MDGDAGVDTIRELIRRLYFNKAIYGRSEIIGNTVTGLVQDTDGRWVYKVNDKMIRLTPDWLQMNMAGGTF